MSKARKWTLVPYGGFLGVVRAGPPIQFEEEHVRVREVLSTDIDQDLAMEMARLLPLTLSFISSNDLTHAIEEALAKLEKS